MLWSMRTDPHAPSALIPADYTWVGYTDDGDSNSDRMADGLLFPPIGSPNADEARRLANPSRVRNAIHPGGCDACGQGDLRYRHYFRHDSTGDVIVLGNDCVKRMNFDNHEAYKIALKIKRERELERIRKEREAWEAANPKAAEFLHAVTEERTSAGGSQYFIMDLASKLHLYGSLSEKQTAAILTVISRKSEIEAERGEAEDLTEIPEELLDGRHEFTGVVTRFKWKDDPAYGGYFAMTLRDDRGFKIWGRCPKGTAPEIDIDASEGTGDEHPRVSFFATLKPKKNDPTFAYFKCPTKPKILSITGEGNADIEGYRAS